MPKCTFRDCNILFRNRYDFKRHQRTAHQNAVKFKVGGKSNHLKLLFKGITVQKVDGMFHCPTCRDSSFPDPIYVMSRILVKYRGFWGFQGVPCILPKIQLFGGSIKYAS